MKTKLNAITYSYSTAGLPVAWVELYSRFVADKINEHFDLAEGLKLNAKERLPENAPFSITCYETRSQSCHASMPVVAKLLLPRLRELQAAAEGLDLFASFDAQTVGVVEANAVLKAVAEGGLSVSPSAGVYRWAQFVVRYFRGYGSQRAYSVRGEAKELLSEGLELNEWVVSQVARAIKNADQAAGFETLTPVKLVSVYKLNGQRTTISLPASFYTEMVSKFAGEDKFKRLVKSIARKAQVGMASTDVLSKRVLAELEALSAGAACPA